GDSGQCADGFGVSGGAADGPGEPPGEGAGEPPPGPKAVIRGSGRYRVENFSRLVVPSLKVMTRPTTMSNPCPPGWLRRSDPGAMPGSGVRCSGGSLRFVFSDVSEVTVLPSLSPYRVT